MITVSAMMVTGCGKKENTDSTVIPSTENTESTQESTSAAQAGDNNSQEETSTADDEVAPKTDRVDNGYPSLEADTSLIPKGETVRSFLSLTEDRLRSCTTIFRQDFRRVESVRLM